MSPTLVPVPFDNATLRAPRNGKPHIALRAGWWRVSPLGKPLFWKCRRWRAAHDEANRRNRTPGL